MHRHLLACCASVLLSACLNPPLEPPSLVSEAESSGWLRTGRYAEAVRLCRDFARAYPGRARCDEVATTPEQRVMVALAVSGDGTLTPEAAARRTRPVLLVQGGIHAGEIEGKDAGFWWLRDLLDGRAAPGALDAVTIVFVPVFNVDGHERFGPNHRPNQRGPEQMGFRTTAQNLNLNRDYMKADAPEMRAMLGLLRRWDPVLYVDLHTTDGAKFEHDVAVMVAPASPREDGLERAAKAVSDAVQARLTALGHLPLDFYPSFVEGEDPASGFAVGDSPPRFSQMYAAARGRIGVLVETHSWHRYPERVRTTYDTLLALSELALRDARNWRERAAEADRVGATLGGKSVTLLYQPTQQTRTIEFRGYAYERRPSEISGDTWTVYDESKPQIWRVPLRDQLAPALSVTAPRAGYLVAPGFADAVAERLDAHGLTYTRLGAPLAVDAEVFRVARATLGTSSFEGRVPVRLEGAWAPERRELAAGALWIPIAQAHARLALHLLEPTAPDSFAAWGMFNAVLERKEYMEPYVTEEVARGMLEDAAVRTAFESALKDPEFAKSPQRRLEFFYRRHPAWDDRKDLLPVYRLDTAPAPTPAARN
jgi:hypothetical protein